MNVLVGFIDEHRDELGVEPICKALQVAPSSYYAAKKRELAPSARAVRDAVMMQVLMVLWVTNRKVYGAHKLWLAARRAGHEIGRDQVARLMRELGIQGVSRRRKKVFSTISDPDATRAADLVKRNFTADRPDALWVTDLTYVPTRSGMAYVCFIVDAFSRRIVGWRAATRMTTDLVLDTLEHAIWTRRQAGITDSLLRTHPVDRRQNTSNHDIDLCQIYGLRETTTRLLRAHRDGLMLTQVIDGQEFLPYLCEPDGKGDFKVRDEFERLPASQTKLDKVLREFADLKPSRKEKLYATGLERGDRVLVALPNGPAAVVVGLALAPAEPARRPGRQQR